MERIPLHFILHLETLTIMAKLPIVVVPDYLTEARYEQEVLEGIAEIRMLQTTDENEMVRRVPEASAILFFHEIQLTEASLGKLPHCKGAVRGGVGYDNIDIHAAGSHGIVVCNVPDYGTEE